jgi:hypothetical protein
MSTNDQRPRLRYPARAILAVAGAWLVFLLLLIIGFGALALIAPIACFYVAGLVGYVGLLSEAHEYARRQAYVVASPKPAAYASRAALSRSRSKPSTA